MIDTDSSEWWRRWLIGLLAVALAIRVVWGQLQPTDAQSLDRLPDQREYVEIARSVLHGDGFRVYDARFRQEVVAFRSPGYPLFLVACGGSIRVTRAAQAVVETSTVLAVVLLARRWVGNRLSLVAGAMVAVNPFLIYMSALILSETLYTALLAWGMFLLIAGGWRAVLACGVLALSVTVRPSGAILPVVLVLGAVALNRRPRGAYSRWWPSRWPLPPAATALLMILAVLLPWAWRNDKLLGRWVWTTTNGGITAYDGFHDEATGASDQRFATSIPGIRNVGELQRDDYFADAARRWMRQHPRRVIELALIKTARTWSPLPLSSEYGRTLYQIAGMLYALPFDLLIIAAMLGCGPIQSCARPRMIKAFLMIPAIYFTLVHALSVGSLRYRLPVEPPLAVLAAAGCGPLLESWKNRFRRANVLDGDGVLSD